MKKALFVVIATFAMGSVLAQNIEYIDTGNVTRERWRDSVFRIDKAQVPTGFLLEYSLFGFDSNIYDGVGNNYDTCKFVSCNALIVFASG